MITITDQELIRYFKDYGSYYAVAKETGLSSSTVKDRLNKLGYKSTYDQHLGKEWVRLHLSNLGPSRVISIPGVTLKQQGFNDSDTIYGKWTTNPNGSLTLTLCKKIPK